MSDVTRYDPEPTKTWLEAPKWNATFKPWGDRLDFLSPEKQHLASGKMRILPPRDPKGMNNATG